MMIGTELVDFVVFDDDEPVAGRVSELLVAKGYDVKISRTQAEVLSLYDEGCRCFILDLTVNEEMDGLILLEMLKGERRPNAFVAILTSQTDPRNQRYASNLQADVFAIKTPDLVEPVDKIFRRMYETETDRDPDHQEFLRLMEDPNWVRMHAGKYVGIVGGRLVAENDDRIELISQLERYPTDVPKYYGYVGGRRPSRVDTPRPID